MTGTDDTTDPAAEAADPATALTRLQHLAEHHPELRPAIATNPSTYPGLLDWLAALGDADVDEAIARRRTLAAGLDPDAQPVTPTRRPTAERFGAAGTSAAAAAPARTDRPTAESPAVRDAGPARPVTPSEGSPLTTSTPDAPPRQVDEPRRAIPWAGIMAVIAAMAIVGLGAWWIFNLPGEGDPGETNAGPTDPAFPPAATTGPDDETDGGPDAGTDDLPAAIAALERVAEESNCQDTGPDIRAIQAFASDAAPTGTWGDPGHGRLVVDALIALKDACGREHTGAVVDQILGDPDTNPALRTAIESDTSWLDVPGVPVDAREMPGFAVAGVNMACVLSGTDVVCTVVGHSLDTPEGCLPGGISVEIDSDGESRVNCLRSANADPLLSDGESAYRGPVACTVTGPAVECWNTETGGGFVLGSSELETY